MAISIIESNDHHQFRILLNERKTHFTDSIAELYIQQNYGDFLV